MTAADRPILPHPEHLKRGEERVLAALMEHATVADAARATGLHRRTVERTLARPHVRDAYRERRAELMRVAGHRLRASAGEAVDTLRAVMADAGAGAARVSAARTVLDMAARLHEDEDLMELVAAVKADRLAATAGRAGGA